MMEIRINIEEELEDIIETIEKIKYLPKEKKLSILQKLKAEKEHKRIERSLFYNELITSRKAMHISNNLSVIKRDDGKPTIIGIPLEFLDTDAIMRHKR